MKNILIKKINKFIDIYSIIYLIIVHVIGIGLISYLNLDSDRNLADIILGVITIIIIFSIANLYLFLPSLFLLACGLFVSFFMAISLPLFLFLVPFQLLGAESVEVLEFGFFKTLLIISIMTPIGILNLLATNKIIN